MKPRATHGRGWKALVAIGALAMSLLFVSPAFADPQTFTVNSTGDQADPDVGVDGCDVGGGVCTLRAAIQEANFNSPQPDTIDFAPSVTGQIVLTSPLPDITDSVTINGPGADQLAIDADNTYRVLVVQSSAANTTISGLTIQHGQAPPVGGVVSAGGGIQSTADMTLDRVVLTDNHAAVTAAANTNSSAFGGALQVGGGTVNLVRSTVRNNNANATASGTGQATSNGGGIWLESGTLHIVRSTIADNQANATVTSGSGSSFTHPGGGGIYMYDATLTIDESTMNGNSATAAGGTNSGLANFASGGGIYQDNLSSLTVTGATITDNSLGTPGGQGNAAQGSNLDLLSGGTIGDTIVGEPVGASNCQANHPLTSNGYNLDADGSCGFNQSTDISGTPASPVDPMLAPPADNGGPTQTRALLPGSPAIDQGKSFGATTDQRGTGFPRISDSPATANAAGGDGSDIGAYEPDVAPPTTTAPVQSLVQGSQLGTSTVPIRFAWTANDDVTPTPQIQSFLQMRTNPSGTWGPFSNLVGPTTAKSATASLSGSTLRQFRVRAKDQAGNFGTSTPGPPFRIVTFQEPSPAIAYTGTWHHATQSSASGGGVQYSTQAGARATLTSTGRNLAVVMPLRSTAGTVRICLDPGTAGQSCATLDLSPVTGLGARKVVFARNGLSPATAHKIAVTVLSGRADLDAFVALR